jgi:hypothetical protein
MNENLNQYFADIVHWATRKNFFNHNEIEILKREKGFLFGHKQQNQKQKDRISGGQICVNRDFIQREYYLFMASQK